VYWEKKVAFIPVGHDQDWTTLPSAAAGGDQKKIHFFFYFFCGSSLSSY